MLAQRREAQTPATAPATATNWLQIGITMGATREMLRHINENLDRMEAAAAEARATASRRGETRK